MKKFSSTTVLGQRVDCVTFAQTYQAIVEATKLRPRRIPSYFFALNLHILLELSENSIFAALHNQAEIIFADGVPLLWLSRATSRPLPERVSGTDLVEKILQERQNVFLLGSTPEVLTAVTKKYPKAVVGSYSPPFGKAWTKKVDEQIIQRIKKSRAKIVMVGVGPLKQERWLLTHLPKTSAAVGMGVGSAFDILAGKTPRAPRLWQSLGLEWVWRVLLEPHRLAKRYIYDILRLLRKL